ncbi:hypothetical protein BH18THE2_BH18THE2_15160 [soil metagenome]
MNILERSQGNVLHLSSQGNTQSGIAKTLQGSQPSVTSISSNMIICCVLIFRALRFTKTQYLTENLNAALPLFDTTRNGL